MAGIKKDMISGYKEQDFIGQNKHISVDEYITYGFLFEFYMLFVSSVQRISNDSILTVGTRRILLIYL
jgi:hypothetical protein